MNVLVFYVRKTHQVILEFLTPSESLVSCDLKDDGYFLKHCSCCNWLPIAMATNLIMEMNCLHNSCKYEKFLSLQEDGKKLLWFN